MCVNGDVIAIIKEHNNLFDLGDGLYKKFESPPEILPYNVKMDLINTRKLQSKKLQDQEIEKTVGISFKVDDKENILRKKGRCYAFLPLSQVNLGTKFDVQGDFNVGLKRKNLKKLSSQLNIWLFSWVGKAWERAFDDYKQQDSAHSCLQLFEIIPLKKDSPEIDEEKKNPNLPFNLIKKSIDSFMRKHRVFLADGSGALSNLWIYAKNAYIPEQESVKELFNIKELQFIEGINARWIHSETPERAKDYLIELIGYDREINSYDMILYKKVLNIIQGSPNKMNPEWFAKLAIAISEIFYSDEMLLAYTENDHLSYSERERIREKIIAVFPILSPDKKTVYRRGDVNEVFYSKSKVMEIISSEGKFSHFIHPGIFKWLNRKSDNKYENEGKDRALRFLKEVVTEINAKVYIRKIIIPHFEKLAKQNWKGIKNADVDAAIEYIYRNKECWDVARNKIPLKAKDGKYHWPEDIYLTTNYDCKFDAANFFSGIENNRIISNRYKKIFDKKGIKEIKREKQKNILGFFKKIGIRTKINLEGGEKRVDDEELKDFLNEEPKPTSRYGYTYYGYKLKDYNFKPEIIKVLKNINSIGKKGNSHKKCSIFLAEIIRNWDYFSNKTDAIYIWCDGTKDGRSKETKEPANYCSWVRLLSDPKIIWIPVIGPSGKDISGVGRAIFPKEDLIPTKNFSIPRIYIPKVEGKGYYKSIRSFQEFFSKMNWEAHPGIDYHIEKVQSMVKKRVQDKEIFVKDYSKIYAELRKMKSEERENKLSLLDSIPWIYTPKKKIKYRRLSQVKWGSLTNLGDWKVDISPYYPHLGLFFVDQIGLRDLKSIDYLHFIQEELTRKKSLNKANLKLLARCYKKIDLAIQEEERTLISEIEKNKESLKFWCIGKKWLTPLDEIFYNDDESLYKQLQKTSNSPNSVVILEGLGSPKLFFDMVGILPLSSIRQPEEVEYDEIIIEDTRWIKNGIRKVIPDIKSILRNKNKLLLQKLEEGDIFEKLKRLDIDVVKNLYFVIPIEEYDSVKNKVNFVIVEEGGKLHAYIDDVTLSNEEKVKVNVSGELDRFLGGFLKWHIIRLLWDATPESRDVILDKEGIKPRRKKKAKPELPAGAEEGLPPIDEMVPGNVEDVEPKKSDKKKRKKPSKSRKRSRKGKKKSDKKGKKGKEKDEDEVMKTEWSRLDIEKRAIELIMNWENEQEKSLGYKAIDVHSEKIGYDIVIIPSQIPEEEYDENKYSTVVKRFIEVKASKKDSEDFVITDQELKKAKKFEKSFYIYRVVNTMTNTPDIYIIQDPKTQYSDAIVEQKALIVEDWKKRRNEDIEFKKIPFHQRE